MYCARGGSNEYNEIMKKLASVFVLLCSVLFVAGCSGCGSGGGSSKTSTDTIADTMEQKNPGPQTGLATTTVRVTTPQTTISVTADVADTDESRATGLMYVYQMPEDKGMVFVFDDDQTRSFWMKNVFIQLDMLFINSAGTVVDINVQAQPQSTTSFMSRAPAKYVLEVNGGWCARNGVSIGDSVFIDGY